MRLQESLARSDVQDERTILYKAGSRGTLPEDVSDMALVIRSLATFNAVASMIHRGAVPADWMLQYWHHHLRELSAGFRMMVEARASWRPDPWPDLAQLLVLANEYRCSECGQSPASSNSQDGAPWPWGTISACHAGARASTRSGSSQG
jgi:hypothetical protein